MLSAPVQSALRWASGLGVLLLLSAHGQAWPWLVSERLDAERASRLPDGRDPERPDAPKPERPPLSVLAALPDPSPQRTTLIGFSPAAERSAGIERGNHASGARDVRASVVSDWALESLAPIWTEQPAPPTALTEPRTPAPFHHAWAIGTSIQTHAPPA